MIAIGNLPYQIASALVLALVAAGRAGAIARAIVMVQREMAKRITAPPGSRVYGRLTVAVAQHAEARILFDVKPGSFHPAPAVISSVLSLVPRAAPLASVRDAALFDEVVKRAFSTRRKMLRRALAAGSASKRRPRRWPRPASPGPGAPRSFRWPSSPAWRMLSRPPGSRLDPANRARADELCSADLIAGGSGPFEGPEGDRCLSSPRSRRSFAAWLRGSAAGESTDVWWSGQGLHLGRKVDLRGLRAVAVGRTVAARPPARQVHLARDRRGRRPGRHHSPGDDRTAAGAIRRGRAGAAHARRVRARGR